MIGFAAIALLRARARRIDSHRRWALRLYLAVGGVWFGRVGLGFWSGVPQYVVPLLELELYFRAQDRGGTRSRFVMAAALVALTFKGIVTTTLGSWVPRIT